MDSDLVSIVSSIPTPFSFLINVCLLSHIPFLTICVPPQSKPKEKEIKGQRKGEDSAWREGENAQEGSSSMSPLIFFRHAPGILSSPA